MAVVPKNKKPEPNGKLLEGKRKKEFIPENEYNHIFKWSMNNNYQVIKQKREPKCEWSSFTCFITTEPKNNNYTIYTFEQNH